jgi:hypothetical protein
MRVREPLRYSLCPVALVVQATGIALTVVVEFTR